MKSFLYSRNGRVFGPKFCVILRVPLKTNAPPDEFPDEFFEMTASKEGEESAASTVTLGEEVVIAVTSSALGDNFYLSECKATNGQDENDEDAYKFQKLVKSGCMIKLTDELTAAIEPVMDGQSLRFKQFAFRGSELFKVECTIRLGEKPSSERCAELQVADAELSGDAGRRRRAVDEMEKDSPFEESTGNIRINHFLCATITCIKSILSLQEIKRPMLTVILSSLILENQRLMRKMELLAQLLP